MKKLTIGMCTYDDYEGVFFTIQAIRMYHPEVIDDIEFVIVDNNPNSEYGQAVKDFTCCISEPCQYIPFDDYKATTVKNKVFEYARTPYVMCIDCHVLLQPGSIKKLLDYYEQGKDKNNLLQGPLVYDDLHNISTHFNKVWGSHMQGQWDNDARYIDKDSEPFEIHAQGMGLFSCRKDAWLGFNPNFRGFGGEEIYIHNKFRAHGKEAICLPFLGWMHRFTRINGVPYPNDLKDRYRNYIFGRIELGLDIDDVEENFRDDLPADFRQSVLEEANNIYKMS